MNICQIFGMFFIQLFNNRIFNAVNERFNSLKGIMCQYQIHDFCVIQNNLHSLLFSLSCLENLCPTAWDIRSTSWDLCFRPWNTSFKAWNIKSLAKEIYLDKHIDVSGMRGKMGRSIVKMSSQTQKCIKSCPDTSVFGYQYCG